MKTSWEEIEAKDLFELVMFEFLSDAEIASRFNVSINAVKRKRKLFKTPAPPEKKYHDMIKKNPKLKASLHDKAKSDLLKKEDVDSLAKVITNYAFRSGPIEDIAYSGEIEQGFRSNLDSRFRCHLNT
jgi:iron uptake system EfeUOB component EfeO/EfeM